MIIYGTGNFNRRNQSVVRCGCPSCGRRDYQRSYTSTRFFTLYFIPVIPLGSQKVLQECQHCDNAFGLSLGDHKKRLKHDLPQAIAEYQEEPSNAEKAENLITMLVRTQETSQLKTFAPQIASIFPDNGELLCTLAEACSYHCLDTLADEYFLMSVNATDDKEIAKSAEHHMKHKGSTKPEPPNRLLQSLPVLIVPGILLFIFGNMFSKALSNRPENIYLVNGLDQAYEVYVNDKLVQLNPYERIEGTMLHWEQNTIRPVEGSLPIEMQTFEIGSSTLADRAFDDTVFIVNPDRAALLSWERTVYTTTAVPENDFKFKVHTGQVLHIFSNVDYSFRKFPDEISMPSSSSRVFKTRIEQLKDLEPSDIVSALLQNDFNEELKSYLEAELKYESDDNLLIRTGNQILPKEQFRELAKPHLAARPVEVAWHRVYQDSRGSSAAIEDENYYRELYEADSENNQLAYLYARASTDPTVSERVFRKAADSSRPSGYASYGLSYHYMVEGDYDATLQYSIQALRWLPDNLDFNHTRRVGLYGKEDFQTIADEAEAKLSVGLDFTSLYDYAYAQAKLGETSKAIERIDEELTQWQTNNQIPPEDVANTRRIFESALALATGNTSGYLKIAKRGTSTGHKFQCNILEHDLEAASALTQATPDDFDASHHLLLTILAKHAGNDSLAENHLKQASAELSKQTGHNEQKWGSWLAGNPLPDKAQVVHACSDIDQHVLYLAALAISRGNEGAPYLDHAKKLIYKESFNSLALKDAQVF